MENKKHIPVLFDEVIKRMDIKPDGIYVDLTTGRAGHSRAILEKLETGTLFSFDKDKQAIKESGPYLESYGDKSKLIHSDFKNFKDVLEKFGIKKVDGILADLGVSSPQLDEAERGFSYNKDAKLDMRMNQEQELSAHDIINSWTEHEICSIFRKYADVKLPQRVAKGISENRPINTTMELVDVIRNSLPAAVVRKKNPAKAVFQALRIAVNEELYALEEMLKQAPDLLNKNGSLLVITFHSIEDRIVKKEFKKFLPKDVGDLPIQVEEKWRVKQVKPSKSEILVNKRSRSAKLRVLTKLKE